MITCKICGAENSEDSRFCIVCGTPISKGTTIMCPNGHIYDSQLSKCPYCPSSDLQEIMGFSKTVSSEPASTMKNDEFSGAATKFMASPEKPPEPQFQGKKTIIASEGDSSGTVPSGRKLVGWLVSFTWDKNGEDYKLYEGRNLIGGSGNVDIVINDPAVSSPHCLILFRDGKFKFKDQLSTNGTKVNGESSEEGELKDGDELKLGRTEFKFRTL